MDVVSGRTTGSERYDSIFGIARSDDDWTWTALLEQVVPDQRAGLADAMRAALAGSGELHEEFQVDGADDGAPRWIELRGRLDEKAGGPDRIVGIAADITERKLAEQALVATNETLEAQVSTRTISLAESNAQLDAFAYTVSHDLRAPLRAMEGFARILLEDHGPALGEDGQNYATRIVGAARRMEGLIDDLLAFSRVQRVDVAMKWFDPARAIRNAIADLRASGFDDSAVTVEVFPPFPPVRADRTILAQVIGNLVVNAAKFRAPDRGVHIAIRAERRAERVRIWVEDDGIGIAPEHQARIFNVFERLHGQETYPGTGVGLAIVKMGVERMGGTCGVESALESGSRFWIELEAAEDGARAARS
jgi:signal transduction histidine kinase